MERFLDCWILKTTGIPCPGCGMTRAYLSFFHGDIKQAIHFHPLFWLVPFVLFLAWQSYRDPDRKKYNQIWTGLLVLFVGVYLIRMIFLFPNSEPLVFDKTALIPRILHLLF